MHSMENLDFKLGSTYPCFLNQRLKFIINMQFDLKLLKEFRFFILILRLNLL